MDMYNKMQTGWNDAYQNEFSPDEIEDAMNEMTYGDNADQYGLSNAEARRRYRLNVGGNMFQRWRDIRQAKRDIRENGMFGGKVGSNSAHVYDAGTLSGRDLRREARYLASGQKNRDLYEIMNGNAAAQDARDTAASWIPEFDTKLSRGITPNMNVDVNSYYEAPEEESVEENIPVYTAPPIKKRQKSSQRSGWNLYSPTTGSPNMNLDNDPLYKGGSALGGGKSLVERYEERRNKGEKHPFWNDVWKITPIGGAINVVKKVFK